ncbi:hypothetical protein CDD81_1084 [Ophiocordyceps australis]|uniref:Thioesterase domain-containing protein n=1 Tax=Ophiocordyceps australis TaxID=1399860 RepID=A0A2C5X889_9HYPO|nr:hypothetical protein CDD81_1084 [Ophiocordyceps australis]
MARKATTLSSEAPLPLSIALPKRLLIPMLNITPPDSDNSVYASTLDYFSSVPWCHALLRDTLCDSSTISSTARVTIPFIPGSRNLPLPQCEQFFGSVLATPDTIPHMLGFFRPDDANHALDAQRPITQAYLLFALGTSLSHYNGIVSGGLVAAIFDVAAGALIDLNTNLDKKDNALSNGVCIATSIKINYLRPVVATGCIVLARIWVESAEERKVFARGELTGSKGERLAEAEFYGTSFRNKL